MDTPRAPPRRRQRRPAGPDRLQQLPLELLHLVSSRVFSSGRHRPSTVPSPQMARCACARDSNFSLARSWSGSSAARNRKGRRLTFSRPRPVRRRSLRYRSLPNSTSPRYCPCRSPRVRFVPTASRRHAASSGSSLSKGRSYPSWTPHCGPSSWRRSSSGGTVGCVLPFLILAVYRSSSSTDSARARRRFAASRTRARSTITFGRGSACLAGTSSASRFLLARSPCCATVC